MNDKMMKIQRCKTTKLYRHARFTACQVSLVVLLSACGSGNDQETAAKSTSTGSVSVSAAQLISDDSTTLSIAQAAGAGLVPVQSVISTTDSGANVSSEFSAAIEASGSTANPAIGAAVGADNEVTDTTTVPTANTDNTANGTPLVQKPAETTQVVEAVATPESEVVPTPEVTPEATPEATPETATAAEATPETIPEAPKESAAVAEAPSEVESSGETNFRSNNTEGFVGDVLNDGVVNVTWTKDPTARGYNVYRAGEYVETVWEAKYIDKNTFDESYYYEVQAFDYDENYNYVAIGLTVEVTGTGRVNPDSPAPKENILDGYELVFSDEFNNTELDSSKWSTSYIWGDELVINSEEQHYVDIVNKPDFGFNPFSFDGESVTISSIRTPDELKDKAFGQEYLSGVMTSYDSFKFTYGYVETRAQLPFGRGLWPAFWLLNAYYIDDKPEIDIMEFIGHNQDTVYHTYHYYDSEGNLRSTESEGSRGTDWTNGWHTYAVEWLPGTLVYYVDGIETHRVIDSKVSQQEMYILANTALGGWWPGSPDNSTQFPAEYKIDYIRAYQKADGTLLADPNEGRPSQLLLWDDVPNASPSHLPPFELFPQGYPERQVIQ